MAVVRAGGPDLWTPPAQRRLYWCSIDFPWIVIRKHSKRTCCHSNDSRQDCAAKNVTQDVLNHAISNFKKQKFYREFYILAPPLRRADTQNRTPPDRPRVTTVVEPLYATTVTSKLLALGYSQTGEAAL